MKTMKRVLALLLVVTMALLVLTACGSTNSTSSSSNSSSNSENSSETMTSDDIVYLASDIYWTGEKLVVEGGIYNLSSSYDVVDAEEVVLYVYDEDANVVVEVNVNEAFVSCIPHGCSASYNFTSKKISSDYKGTTDFYIAVEFSGDYEECQGLNCSNCAKWSSNMDASGSIEGETCSFCNGTGYGTSTCTNCSGTGIEPLWESTKGKSIHAFVDKECYKCGGTGKSKCLSCNGLGVIY